MLRHRMQAEKKHIWIRMSARPPQHALITTRKLALGGVDFIGFLEEKLGVSTAGVDEDEIVKLIGMLNSDQYSERERASIALKKFGPHAISLANQALKNAKTAEIRYRITKLLSQPVVRPPIDPQELCRLHRSIMALEMMASGDAVAVSEQAASEVVKRAIFALQSLALGHENIDVANDATNGEVRGDVSNSGTTKTETILACYGALGEARRTGGGKTWPTGRPRQPRVFPKSFASSFLSFSSIRSSPPSSQDR